MEYGKASLGDLFDPKYRRQGLACGRTRRWPRWAAGSTSQGKLPQPWLDGYKDMDVMKANSGTSSLAEAVKAKANIAQFWKGENEAQAAFRTNGACSACAGIRPATTCERRPAFGYIAPKEGAFAWNQGFVLMKNAKNVEQAHEFAKFVATPEGRGAARRGLLGQPGRQGRDRPRRSRRCSASTTAAFPGDALSKLWWWPEQSS